MCLICRKTLSVETTHYLACGHSFHTVCISNWFQKGYSVCPQCQYGSLNVKNRITFPNPAGYAKILQHAGKKV